MGRPSIEESKEREINDLVKLLVGLSKDVAQQGNRLMEIESKVEYLMRNRGSVSIQKVEEFNGEKVPDYTESNMKMNHDEQVFSIINTLKILPPNMIINGRHSIDNVQSLNGRFRVTDELMDEAYSRFKHDDWFDMRK
jgi:hypothetical protein